jgi:hypothetical protein
VFGNSTTKIN